MDDYARLNEQAKLQARFNIHTSILVELKAHEKKSQLPSKLSKQSPKIMAMMAGSAKLKVAGNAKHILAL